MSYRRALLFRWSTRDLLAVLVLAVVVAFLTGGALFYAAASDEPTEMAREFAPVADVEEYGSVSAAREHATRSEVVVPFSELDRGGLVAAMDRPGASRAAELGLDVPPIPDEGVGAVPGTLPNGAATGTGEGEVTLRADGTAVTVRVTRLRDSGFLPARWYVSRPAVVDRLGASGAFVVSAPGGSDARQSGGSGVRSSSVIRGTLLFFERGTEQVLRGFAVVVVAAGVLGAVTIASVVRMTVRDRTETIQVVRATGGTGRSLVGLFALRGGLLTAVAIALGYALGVVTSSVVTSVAVFSGLPTTLSPRVTADAVPLLAGAYLPIGAVGFAAGAVAAVPAVRRPPGRLTDPATPAGSGRSRARAPANSTRPSGPTDGFGAVRRLRSLVATRVLDWRAVVPTVATVAVFVAVALLVSGGGAVAGPLSANGSSTVVESDAAHPVASAVPASYAAAYRDLDVAASPEILVFGVVDGQPSMVRGAEFDSFAAVSDAELVAGRRPRNDSEALVGVDFSRTHGVSVGDPVVVGAGTDVTVERVHVVGSYRAPSAYDDQLLVSIPSARHLAPIGHGEVNFVRLSGAVAGERPGRSVGVYSLDVEGRPTTERVSVSVGVVNVAGRNRTVEIPVRLGEARVTTEVTVPAGGRETASVSFAPGEPGTYALVAGEVSREVDVRDPNDLVLSDVPGEAPPGSAPLVRVRTVGGPPAANATVVVGNRTFRTDANGYVRVPLESTGTTVIRARKDGFTARTRVAVVEGASRDLRASVVVDPPEVRAFTRPSAIVRLYNPWNETASGRLGIRGPDRRAGRSYRVGPGESARFEIRLSRLPSGEYAVRARIGGETAAEATYAVTGDDRLSSVVVRHTDATAGGGLGRAIAIAFGNLTVVVAALVALAGTMVGGALAASFARSIHARRETIGVYRATGASPRSIVATVTADALRIGAVSVVAGVALGALAVETLGSFDLLVFYGISVTPTLTPSTLLGVGGAALALVLVGALVPTVAALRAPPASAFSGVRVPERSIRPAGPSVSDGERSVGDGERPVSGGERSRGGGGA